MVECEEVIKHKLIKTTKFALLYYNGVRHLTAINSKSLCSFRSNSTQMIF